MVKDAATHWAELARFAIERSLDAQRVESEHTRLVYLVSLIRELQDAAEQREDKNEQQD